VQGDVVGLVALDLVLSVVFARMVDVWNGGGEGSVHSSVVAPAPHGLGPASRLRAKARSKLAKNISMPTAETYAPIDAIKFQSPKASG
jgi:hypothetical protein